LFTVSRFRGFKVQGLQFQGSEGSRFRVYSLKVQRVQGSGFKVSRFRGFKVQGLQFQGSEGSRFRV
jgi:hypothetical protein